MSACLSGSLEQHRAVTFSKLNFLKSTNSKYLMLQEKKKKINQVVFQTRLVFQTSSNGKKNKTSLSTAPSLPPFTHKSTRCCDVDGHLEKSSLIVEERAVFPALGSTMRISATIFTSNN